MKRHQFLLLSSLLWFALPLCAQSDPYAYRWSYDFPTGITVGARKIQSIIPDVTFYYSQVVGPSLGFGTKFFWSRHWGIRWQADMGGIPTTRIIDDRITDELRNNVYSGVMFNTSTGIVYRKEFRSFSLHPHLSLGFGAQGKGEATTIYRKHPDSNDIDCIGLDLDGNFGFSINPGMYAACKLSRRISLFVEATYIINLYKSSPIEVSISDPYTKKILNEFDVKGKRQDLILVRFGMTLRR
jgi:hypothetical protein